jgi:hypothetical protein
MVKLTQEQFDALIEYINAAIEDVKLNADLYDTVRRRRALEVLEKALLSNSSTETED